jgi:hypothetical protein
VNTLKAISPLYSLCVEFATPYENSALGLGLCIQIDGEDLFSSCLPLASCGVDKDRVDSGHHSAHRFMVTLICRRRLMAH